MAEVKVFLRRLAETFDPTGSAPAEVWGMLAGTTPPINFSEVSVRVQIEWDRLKSVQSSILTLTRRIEEQFLVQINI